jgi:hypothetical protein
MPLPKYHTLFLDEKRLKELAKSSPLGESTVFFLERDRHDHDIGVTGEDDWIECELRAALVYWTLYDGNQHYTQFVEMKERNIREVHDALKELRE